MAAERIQHKDYKQNKLKSVSIDKLFSWKI